MRKFYLYCDDLTRIDLNGGTYLFTSPTGLGVSWNNNISELGNGFGAATKREQKIGQVVGKLVIQKSGNKTAYDVYNEFANKVLGAKKLVLGYQPGNTEYKSNVILNYLTKTESHDEFFIEIPIAFDMLSLWYTEDYAQITNGVTRDIDFEGNVPAGILLYCENCLGKPHIFMSDDDATDIINMSADLTETGVRSFFFSTEQDNSRFVSYETGEDLSQYITSISNPELIYGRPTKRFRIRLEDDLNGQHTKLNGSVTIYRYRRTV